jgi:hypothetical protein
MTKRPIAVLSGFVVSLFPACSSDSTKSADGLTSDAGDAGDAGKLRQTVDAGPDVSARCPRPTEITESGSCSIDPGQSCPSSRTQVCCGATTGTGTEQFCTCAGGTWVCMFFCTAACDSGVGSDDAQPHDASPIDAPMADAASIDSGGGI